MTRSLWSLLEFSRIVRRWVAEPSVRFVVGEILPLALGGDHFTQQCRPRHPPPVHNETPIQCIVLPGRVHCRCCWPARCVRRDRRSREPLPDSNHSTWKGILKLALRAYLLVAGVRKFPGPASGRRGTMPLGVVTRTVFLHRREIISSRPPVIGAQPDHRHDHDDAIVWCRAPAGRAPR